MSETSRQAAQHRIEQTGRIQALVDILRALLDGGMTRASVQTWAREQPDQPSVSATAHAVLESLRRITERDGPSGPERVGEAELRAYLRALVGGARFVCDSAPLCCLGFGIARLSERVSAAPTRWWQPGRGWVLELELAAFASSRPFLARASAAEPERVEIHKHAEHPWRAALVDLFEQLAVDERDTIELHADVDLDQLPVWALWREDDNANKFEMGRYHSYAKALHDEQVYRDRGHRQLYWVDAVC